jgi:hypothetical protein
VFREVTDVEKHHADLADVTCELRRTVQQAVDDRWRHVLAKEVGNPLARDRLIERTSELRAQPERDKSGYPSLCGTPFFQFSERGPAICCIKMTLLPSEHLCSDAAGDLREGANRQCGSESRC